MEVRNMEYDGDTLKIYYRNTSAYTFIRNITKEAAKKIKQGYMEVLNKVKQEL